MSLEELKQRGRLLDAGNCNFADVGRPRFKNIISKITHICGSAMILNIRVASQNFRSPSEIGEIRGTSVAVELTKLLYVICSQARLANNSW